MNMVEKVARAIDGDLWQSFDSHCRAKEWTSAEVAQEKMTRHVMQASFLRARAAIEAMREPTQAMIDAGFYPAVQNRGAKSVWPTMIDAALSE